MIPLADPQRFVGRHRQLVALQEALESRSRLVTLHGPSGVGKSRLSAEHLNAVRDERRTLAVDLEDAASLRDVLALTASALEAPAAAADPVLVLADRLRELGPVTVVLDHVDDVSAELANPLSRWLALCPEAHFVVTAEQPLGLPVEHACAVLPLSLPVTKGDRIPSDALRLWHLLRGSEVRRDKAVDAELVELLRALSGLPLLIELLSALAEQLTPYALLERLSPKLRALGHSPAPDDVLHTVLSAVWTGFSEAERLAFARCAVFGSSFDREAYAAVHEGEDAGRMLERLVARRVVSRLHTSDGSERFGLHHALRRAARTRLASVDARGDASARHARFYVERGSALAEALEGRDGARAMRSLIREQGNLLAIVSRVPRAGDLDDVSAHLRALCVRDHVLSSFGPVDTDLARLDRALFLADGVELAPSTLTEALCVRAFVRARTGDFAGSSEDLARALKLSDEPALRGSYSAGRVAVTVAFVSLSANKLDEAEAEARRALAIAEQVGHVRLQGIALGVYALVRRVRGHEDEARALYEQALACHRSVENRRFEGIVMTRLAQLLVDAGEADRALAMADEARALHEIFGDRLMAGLCLELRGVVSHARGELEEARQRLEAARPMLAAAGGAGQSTATLTLLARVRMELGDFDQARQLFGAAQRAHRERSARRDAALCLARRAGLEALHGELAAARESFGQVDHVPSDEMFAALVSLERAQLDFADMRRARAQRDPDAEAEARMKAESHRRELVRVLSDVPGLTFRDVADANAALRVFDALLRGHTAKGAGELALSLETRSFVGPTGARVDMAERPALRRILTRLCMQALRAPGSPQRALSLFAAGWPGENPGDENARLQVYAVLANLRKHGLGAALISNDHGHMLAPSLLVRFA